MYEVKSKFIDHERIKHFQILQESTILRYADVIQLWMTDKVFVQCFIDLLATCPYTTFRWETPPITIATMNQPFQCVCLDAPELSGRRPNTRSFAQYLSACSNTQLVTSFDNLGGDATMIVPASVADDHIYTDLAIFSRTAPPEQQVALWRLVGAVMKHKISAKPIWLSTAGGGVAWLHVRLDSRPKYYGYAPFKRVG